MAVQEPEYGAVDVQGVGSAKPSVGEKFEDVFERA
jgi:hypothetical protein